MTEVRGPEGPFSFGCTINVDTDMTKDIYRYMRPDTGHYISKEKAMIPTKNNGAHQVRRKIENRNAIFNQYMQDLNQTRGEVAEALGFSVQTVIRHVKAINAGWRPEGWEGK